MKKSPWTNIKKKYPERGKWVIVDTPYCKYPAAIARWNGFDWHSPDVVEVWNVSYWMDIPEIPK